LKKTSEKIAIPYKHFLKEDKSNKFYFYNQPKINININERDTGYIK